MNWISIEFLNKIYDADIIYHYTKASTAIDYILYNNQLRFSKSRKSIDPIESEKAHRRTIYFGETESLSNDHYADVDELHNIANGLEERFSFISFCNNDIRNDSESANPLSTFTGNQELFGFTKFRMWDQYADNFAGVCIAFSKQKILSLNQTNLELIEGNVEYLTIQDLSTKKLCDIQGDHLRNVGKERYKEKIDSILKKSFFLKHIDYSGENEYRIGKLYDESKYPKPINHEVVRENMMLNISGCIEAIFVSSYVNQKQKDELLKYADNLKVKIVEMKWKHNGFEIDENYSFTRFFLDPELLLVR